MTLHYFLVCGVQRTLSEARVAAYFAQYGHVDTFRLKRNAQGQSFGYGELHMTHCSEVLLNVTNAQQFVIDDVTVTLYPITRPTITHATEVACDRKVPLPTPTVPQTINEAPAVVPQPQSELTPPPSIAHAAISAELYACLPISHLLVGQLSDPQLLLAQLDPTRLGCLTIVNRTAALHPDSVIRNALL